MLERPANDPEDFPDADDVTTPMRADDDYSAVPSKLDKLLLEWEERAERGGAVTPEALCADAPELLGELKRLIKLLGNCEKVIGSDQNASEQPTPMSVPGRLGYYEVSGVLGSGGGGVVYRAWDPFLKCHVAIKCVSPHRQLGPFEYEAMVARFHMEVEFLGKLDHPNIVPVRSAFPDNRQLYLVMGFMPGGSLCAHVERLARGDPRQVALLVEKVARAVHYAHQKGIFHRDLKPGNILIDEAGEPRVADFGLAKLLQETVEEPGESIPSSASGADTLLDIGLITSLGHQPGTAAYMSPEQYDETLGGIGVETDIWALGVILFELLSGRRPFAGKDRRELKVRICETEPALSLIGRERKTRGFDRIIRRCLDKVPAKRYATAQALADDLAACRHGRLRTWVQRHRRLVTASVSSAVLFAFLTVAMIGVYQYVVNSRRDALHRKEAAWNARAKGIDLCQRGELGAGLLWLAEALKMAPTDEVRLQQLLRLDLGAG